MPHYENNNDYKILINSSKYVLPSENTMRTPSMITPTGFKSNKPTKTKKKRRNELEALSKSPALILPLTSDASRNQM